MTERERFEHYQAAEIGMDYEEIKCRFDEYERIVGERYGKKGQFAKDWKVWSAAVPEGYVVVPFKATPKMIHATWNCDDEIRHMSHNTRNEFIYDSMIKAAQETNNGR